MAEAWAGPTVAGARPMGPQPTVTPTVVAKATAARRPAPTATPTSGPTLVSKAALVAKPTTASSPWTFDGNVSWYGPGFYGGRTACGETLTKTLLGVANRTLPCGTLVTFRNPANGRTVTVPVVDRGPYVSGRNWDMTGGLCVYLDHCYTGSIQWHLGR